MKGVNVIYLDMMKKYIFLYKYYILYVVDLIIFFIDFLKKRDIINIIYLIVIVCL